MPFERTMYRFPNGHFREQLVSPDYGYLDRFTNPRTSRLYLYLIPISEPTRLRRPSFAVFCLNTKHSQTKQIHAKDKHYTKHKIQDIKYKNSESKEKCNLFLTTLREQARFSLKQTKIDGPLPHKKEIKIQVGGLLGLQRLIEQTDDKNISDIIALLKNTTSKYKSIENFPYDDIIQSIVNFEIRSKHKSR